MVDDHPPIRLAIKTVLGTEKDLRIVGEAEDAEEALQLAKELEPDLVILDLRLRGEHSGLELCREIKSLSDPPYVMLYTAYNSPQEIASCRLSGADSYVHKSEDAALLLDIIKSIRAGKERWVLGIEMEEVRIQLQTAREQGILTDREMEVYGLLLQRRTNPEIARELSVSPETVKTHVTNVLHKLEYGSRYELT